MMGADLKELADRPGHVAPLLMTAADVAKALRISVRSVWRLSSGNVLPPPIAVGRSRRWEREAIEKFVAAQAKGYDDDK